MTEISLCNEALDWVGASPIQSLSDGTIESDLCARAYPEVRDRVLREYPWNCAQTRARVPLLLANPGWGFAGGFALPESPDYCLRVLAIEAGDIPWRIEQLRLAGSMRRVLLTDAPAPLGLLFIRRITDASEMDPLLFGLIAAELAVRLSAKLTESASRQERLAAQAESLRQRAMRVDAQEAAITLWQAGTGAELHGAAGS